MPRTLKRRSELISGGGAGRGRNADVDEDVDAEAESSSTANRRRQQQQQQHSPSPLSEAEAASESPISSAVSSPDPTTSANVQAESRSNNTQVLIKKLVRLSLSTEYARQPLRRSDITQKILKDNGNSSNAGLSHRQFRPVFDGAQKILQQTFGMTLVELPSREKVTLKERRTQTQQQTQTKSQAGISPSSSSSNKSWILVSTLPEPYKQNPTICIPAQAPSHETESEYTALYTFILSLIYLNNSVLTDAKLERYLKRVNADVYTSVGPMDKVLQRMVREGYVERKRDVSSGEEVVEWTVGPRGKVEVGVRGVAGLVRGVYGLGGLRRGNDDGNDDGGEGGENEEVVGGSEDRRPKIEEDDLNARLERSLGLKMSNARGTYTTTEQTVPVVETDGVDRPRKGRRRKQNDNDEDDDDD